MRLVIRALFALVLAFSNILILLMDFDQMGTSALQFGGSLYRCCALSMPRSCGASCTAGLFGSESSEPIGLLALKLPNHQDILE